MEREDIFQDDPANRSPLALDQETLLNDQFRIGRVLGVGGFGITYLAFDEVLEMVVAVKEYLPNDIAVRKSDGNTIQPLSSSDEGKQGFEYGLERFLQEARTLAKFERHPNIVRVRTFFEANGTAYLVMNFYQGRTLAEYLEARNGFLPEEETLLIMDQVLDGLRAVHEEDVLHRDIDPNNVYLADDGTVVLLDFGAARTAVGEQTQSMSVVLKRGYAPHEQYHSHGDQGPWSDIYACSATFYRALTGYKPPEAAARILNDNLAAPNELVPSLSDATNDAVLEGLSIRPEDRPQSVQEFADLLPEPPEKAEPGWIGEPTTTEETTADTESAAELQVTASHACRVYVDGTLLTELPAEETYSLAVEPGSHRVRAVRTDRASSGSATVTASGVDDTAEEGSRMSLDALMWQQAVSVSADEPTPVDIDFEDETAAEAPSSALGEADGSGETVAAGAAEIPMETERPDDAAEATEPDEEELESEGAEEEVPDESDQEDEVKEAATDGEEADEEVPVRERADESPEGAVEPDEDESTEQPSPPPEPPTAPPPARIYVQTDRAGQLFVNGERKVRLVPDGDEEIALPPGHHQLRVEAMDGPETWEQEVEAEADTTRSLQVRLDTGKGTDGGSLSAAALRYGGGAGVLALLLLIGWWALRNEAPVTNPDRTVIGAESVVLDVVANDRDPDGSEEALHIQSAGPLPDSVGHVEAVDSTRLRIEPAAEFAGVTRASYTVADASGDTAQSHVTIRVRFNGVQRLITRQAEQPQDVQAAPLAGDGLDVAIAALDSRAVGWVPNASSETGRFDSLSVLEQSDDGAVDIHVDDLTGNERLDLLSASLRADAVTWYENQSDGAFGEPQSITTEVDGPVSVQTADVDGDGDMDVIVGALLGEQILWYENQGDGQFGPGREIASGVRGLEVLHVTDLDNDDTPDLLAVSFRDSTITRYEPRPSADPVRFEEGPSLSLQRGGPIEVHTADVTNNGWDDILVGLSGPESVILLENQTDTTGTLQFGDRRVLEADVETVEGIDTGDIGSDGTPDVFVGGFDSDAVVWLQNEGNGRFGAAKTVASDVPDPLSLEVDDVNGDGTPDVIVASQAGNMVAWYENHLQ